MRCSSQVHPNNISQSNMSSSHSRSPVRDRRRTPMACMNCRVRKLKCRPSESAEDAPCERCIKEGTLCQYRPVESSSASNNHAHNYPEQDNPVNLYPVHPVPPPNQQTAPPVNQYWTVPPPVSGGYPPNPIFSPTPQAPFQPNTLYPTSPYHQHVHSSSYPAPPQYSYPTSGYSTGQSNYQPSQFASGGHPPPNQYIAYAPAPGPYHDQRSYNGYGNQMDHASNSAKQ